MDDARAVSPALLRRIGAVALGYAASGWLGLLLAVPPGYATAVWPPSGIALAGILAWGSRCWPGVWLGSSLVNVWVASSAADTQPGLNGFLVAASIGAGSTIQALVAAFLLRRWLGAERLFESAPATLFFMAIVAACCTIAPTWGTTTILLAGVMDPTAFQDSWRTWWLGDVMGVIVLAPVLLNWRQLLPARERVFEFAECAGAMALLVTVTALVFLHRPALPVSTDPLTFLPLPLLVWIACRTSPGGVAFATALVAAIAIVATSNQFGPFASPSTHESLMLLQGFLGLTALTALTLAASVTRYKVSTSSLRKLSAQYEQLALTDELTGLYNRRGFLLLSDQAWRFARRSYTRCVLMFMDVDGLKRVNDTHGHQVGDELLLNAGRVIASVFRETDVIARVGGDEFAVFALVDGAEAMDAARQRLQTRIDEFNALRARPYRISLSVGVEVVPIKGGGSLEELLARADQAMYARKRERVRQRQLAEREAARDRQAQLF
jgi:diguanylate cyclase (GGDEF)-like protein